MDIKLKSRHKFGIILIFAALITAAAFAVDMYPYVGRRAKDELPSYQEVVADDISIQVMNGVYTIWMEQAQQKAGHLLTPSQIFIPDLTDKLAGARKQEPLSAQIGLVLAEELGEMVYDDRYDYYDEDYYDEDYYLNMQSFMDYRGNSWKNNFSKIASALDYQLLDNNRKVLAESRQNKEASTIHAELVYDSLGNMTVTYEDDSGANPLSQKLSASLNYYQNHNPLQQFAPDYAYSGVEFQGPRDVIYNFWLPERLLTQMDSFSGEGISPSMVFYSGALNTLAAFLIFAVSVLALVLPCFKSLGIGQEKIFRAPFEIVTAALVIGLVILADSWLPSALVAYTLNGTLAAEIQNMGIAPGDAQELVYVFNGFVWLIALGAVYWIITCYRSIFSLGLWRYMKERSFFGYFCCWIKRQWDRFYQEMQNVDFSRQSTKVIGKIVFFNFLVLTLICCFWFAGVAALIIYSILLFIVLEKYCNNLQEKHERLLEAFRQVAAGNFDTRIDGELGIFEPFRAQLETIQDGLKQAVDKEVKSQKLKTELITNVSHDLKTPLTAIITYVNLLKEENLSEAERDSYIKVLEQKSMRLKVLIEDLFEVSKANSNNITLHPEPVDVVNLLKQVRHELSDKLTKGNLDFRWNLPEEKKILLLDGQKTCRIFENLLLNIAKYAMPGTRAYIDMKEIDGRLVIIMRNISATELQVNGSELTERFIRGDESRNTEGSGLGLAIAKSFTEVQGGTLIVETEADLFRVVLSWPVK